MADSGDESDFASAESDPEEMSEGVTEGKARVDTSPTQGKVKVDTSPTQGKARVDTSPTQGKARVDTSPTQAKARVDTSPTQAKARVDTGGKRIDESTVERGAQLSGERSKEGECGRTLVKDDKAEDENAPTGGGGSAGGGESEGTVEEGGGGNEARQTDKDVRREELKGREEERGSDAKAAKSAERESGGKSTPAEAEVGGNAGTGVAGGDRELQQRTAPAPAPTGEGGGGGGWGWGGWGKSLWSSVSTVTESAQALGQKVTAAITSVEDALGLPAPHQLAAEKEGDREGEGEGSKEEGEEEREEKSGEGKEGKVKTLAKLAEEIVEPNVPPQAPIQTEPSSILTGHQVEPKSDRDQEESTASIGAFSGFLTGIATAVEQRGIQLMSEGLGALENIGKKTMEVLTEGDPGLQNKRKLLKGDTPSLSVLLREAKAEAETKQKEAGESRKETHTPLSYSGLFDEYHGVVHLEALELLSKEYDAKVRGALASLTGEEGEAVQQQMELVAHALTIKENEGLNVLDDDSGKLGEIVELFSHFTLPLKVEKLIKVSDFWREKLKSMSASMTPENEGESAEQGGGGGGGGGGEGSVKVGQGEGEREDEEVKDGDQKDGDQKDERGNVEGEEGEKDEPRQKDSNLSSEEVYENGLRGLVELTSVSIELFRKMAEISLLPQAVKVKANTVEQAERYNRLTVLVSDELDALASVHAEVLTDLATTDVNSTITSLYLESSNSASYVQDALQLLKPVLQYSVLHKATLHEPGPNVHARS